MVTAPELMKEWRTAHGVSQASAAKACDVRQNTWSDWENGRKSPQIRQALRIARVTQQFVPVAAWGDEEEADARRVASPKKSTQPRRKCAA